MTAPVGSMQVAVIVSEQGSAVAAQRVRGVGTAIEEVTGSARTGSTALPSFYQGAEEAGLKAGGAERGIRRMEFALSAVAAQALFAKNANETMADSLLRVGEAALLFAGGSETALGFGAGLASFALTWRGVTEEIRDANAQATKLTSEMGRMASEGRPLVALWERQNTLIQQNAETAERLLHPGFVARAAGVAQAILPFRTQATEELEAGQILDLSNVATERTMNALMGRDRPTTTARVGVERFKSLIAQRGAAGDISGALGEMSNAQSFLRSITGLSPETLNQASMTLAEELTRVVTEGIKSAGENLNARGAQRDARIGILALQSMGLGAEQLQELRDRISGSLLSATEEQQKAFGPGALTASARARMRVLSLSPATQGGLLPPPAPNLFGETAAPNFLTTTNVSGTIQQSTTTGLSAVGNVKAMDDGAKAAAKFADAADKAAVKVENAGEKFSVTLTRSIGDAIILAIKGRSVSGVLAGASSVLGTIGQERFTADDQKADPANVAGSLKFPGLGMASTILGLAAGFTSVFGDLFRHGISISDYGPVALAQLRALMVQGGIVAINITDSGGQSSSSLQYQIQRNSSRDSIPRYPNQPVGAGR